MLPRISLLSNNRRDSKISLWVGPTKRLNLIFEKDFTSETNETTKTSICEIYNFQVTFIRKFEIPIRGFQRI